MSTHHRATPMLAPCVDCGRSTGLSNSPRCAGCRHQAARRQAAARQRRRAARAREAEERHRRAGEEARRELGLAGPL